MYFNHNEDSSNFLMQALPSRKHRLPRLHQIRRTLRSAAPLVRQVLDHAHDDDGLVLVGVGMPGQSESITLSTAELALGALQVAGRFVLGDSSGRGGTSRHCLAGVFEPGAPARPILEVLLVRRGLSLMLLRSLISRTCTPGLTFGQGSRPWLRAQHARLAYRPAVVGSRKRQGRKSDSRLGIVWSKPRRAKVSRGAGLAFTWISVHAAPRGKRQAERAWHSARLFSSHASRLQLTKGAQAIVAVRGHRGRMALGHSDIARVRPSYPNRWLTRAHRTGYFSQRSRW
jgi:hypothetical protein